VGQLQREPGGVPVGEPVPVGGEVGRVLEGDGVELVDHEALGHPLQEGDVGQPGDLVGPVDEVDRGRELREVDPLHLHELDARQLGPQLVHVGRGCGRHQGDELVDPRMAGQGAQRVHHDVLGAHLIGAEAHGIDADGHAQQRSAGAREGVGQRRGRVAFRDGHPLAVPRVAAAHDGLVPVLAGLDLGGHAEAGPAPVVGEHVVGAHVAQAVGHGPLAPVDLLAVAGVERLVEAAHQVEGVTAEVHAVPDGGRDRRAQLEAGLGHPTSGLGGQQAAGERGPRPVAVGHREDRPVVGEAGGAGHRVRAVGGRRQALQPLGPDHHVAVDHHHVSPGRGREGVVARAHEPAVPPVAQDHDVLGHPTGRRLQQADDAAVDAGVVHHQHGHARTAVGDDGLQALHRVLVGVMDGHRDHGRRRVRQPLPRLLHGGDCRDGHCDLSEQVE
jgi:hypothetical protein